ncbi:MAG TPA: MarR family transcriptional regulator [Acidimicrobiales bacterium]|jgi:DNA-binding MarR family transcriptional regulator|nr:MarR family transcriptional regulator [Acidimicrobiales bacterium]
MAGSTDEVTAAIQTLFRLGGSRRIHQQQSAAAGVSLSPQALRVLERTVEAGQTTPGQLAHRLDLDPAVVTRLLRQLEDSGLVSRARSPEDGRVSTVEATDAGLGAFRRVRDVIWDQVRRTLASWPDEDVGQLAGLLGRLVRDVQQEPYRPLAETTDP